MILNPRASRYSSARTVKTEGFPSPSALLQTLESVLPSTSRVTFASTTCSACVRCAASLLKFPRVKTRSQPNGESFQRSTSLVLLMPSSELFKGPQQAISRPPSATRSPWIQRTPILPSNRPPTWRTLNMTSSSIKCTLMSRRTCAVPTKSLKRHPRTYLC